MSEELMITKEDLVNWLNRPPSNDDLDLIGFITTRLENFYKLEQENKQLKSILTELEKWCKDGIKDELFEFDYGTKIIGTPVKMHLTFYEMVLDKIQKLKEDFK